MLVERVMFADVETDEFFEILDERGPEGLLEYVTQWHYPGEHEQVDYLGYGTSDETFEHNGYVLAWNRALGYVSLEYIEEEEV